MAPFLFTFTSFFTAAASLAALLLEALESMGGELVDVEASEVVDSVISSSAAKLSSAPGIQ